MYLEVCFWTPRIRWNFWFVCCTLFLQIDFSSLIFRLKGLDQIGTIYLGTGSIKAASRGQNYNQILFIAPIYDKPKPPLSNGGHQQDQYEEKQDTLPPTLFYSDRHIPADFNPKTGPHHFDEPPHALPLEQEFEDKYIPSDSYR